MRVCGCTGTDVLGEMVMKKIMRTPLYLLIITFAVLVNEVHCSKNKHFMVAIPSRNNSQWVERCLNSLCSQTYQHWHAIYLNDCSTDNTAQKVEQFIQDHGLEDKILLINNETRLGALANMVKAVYLSNDWDVMVTLDGDDWFKDAQVLQKLNEAYADDNVWLTYGSYEEFPSGKKGLFSKPIPANIIAANGYRKHTWSSSHLRTFYAWLFKCINIEDLKIDGEFFQMSGDLAHMIILLELSGGRFKYIPDILYVYNLQTSLNDHKVNRALQAKLEKAIRSRSSYQPLKNVPAKYLPRR